MNLNLKHIIVQLLYFGNCNNWHIVLEVKFKTVLRTHHSDTISCYNSSQIMVMTTLNVYYESWVG